MSTSFGAATGDYDTGRPSYPAEAVQWLLDGANRTVADVLDVGAGTGKLTAGLVADGRRVTAVDPDAAMLDKLTANLPGVTTAVGTAESIPVADGAFDAAVLGQAWHWVDAADGSAELGRVLRPGGVLGLIWNIRDERTEWVAELGGAIHLSAAESLIADGGPTVQGPFGAPDHRRFEWTRPATRSTIEAMFRSRSYYLTATESERQRIEDGAATVLDRLGIVSPDATVEFPYITHAYRYVR